MFDLHSHIIFNIDDGSPDEESTRALLRMAAATGTRHICATPHVIEAYSCPSWELILQRTGELEKMAVSEHLDLRIYSGAELELNWDMLDILRKEKGAYCLGGGRYLLVELPALSIPDYTEDFWYELGLLGITPVLAHPERHEGLMSKPERLLRWLKSGVLTQMNGGSITGRFGKTVQRHAELLLNNDLIYFLGSDAHRAVGRNTDLSDARARLAELVGKEKTIAICEGNPSRLLRNEDIPVINVPSVIKYPKKEKRGFLAKLFGG